MGNGFQGHRLYDGQISKQGVLADRLNDIETFLLLAEARERIRRNGWGILTETFPVLSNVNSASPSSGAGYGGLIGLVSGDVVSNIIVAAAVAGAGAAPTLIRVGLADKTGKILGISADVHADAQWTSGGLVIEPLSSPVTIAVTDVYYPVFLKVGAFGTTDLALARGPSFSASIAGALGSGPRLSPVQTGLADLPAVGSSLAFSGTSGNPFWFAVS